MEPLLCSICDHKSVFYSKNLSSLKSKQSKTPIFDFIKRFLDSELPERFSLNPEDTIVCLECLYKIDEYDLACLTVKRVEQELREILLHTESRYQQAADEAAANQLFECIDVATIDVIKLESDLSDEYSFKNVNYGQNENSTDGGTSSEKINSSFTNLELSKVKNEDTNSNAKPIVLNILSRKRATLPYKCPTCLAAFSSSAHLAIHRRKHIKIVPKESIATKLVEPIASTAIKSIYSKAFASTKLEKSKSKVKIIHKWSCRECPSEFFSRDDLAEHYRLHEVPQYRCDICGHECTDERDLDHHKELHQHTPPLECIICHVTLKSKGGLFRHMLIHGGKTFFQCDKCGKDFIRKSSLEVHMKVHNDIRDKECPHCSLKFRTSSAICRHLQTHTGVKPHACPDCGRKFVSKYNMRVHRQQHNEIKIPMGKMHNCSICELSFDRPSKLNDHYRRIHETTNPQTKVGNAKISSNEVI